jgi:hypothetical protein
MLNVLEIGESDRFVVLDNTENQLEPLETLCEIGLLVLKCEVHSEFLTCDGQNSLECSTLTEYSSLVLLIVDSESLEADHIILLEAICGDLVLDLCSLEAEFDDVHLNGDNREAREVIEG